MIRGSRLTPEHEQRPWLSDDELRAAEARWTKRSYRYRVDDGFQCGGCRFFAATGADFGICANPDGPLDGSITFEHGGCRAHSERDQWGGRREEAAE